MKTETIDQPARLAIEIEWDPEEQLWVAQVPALNNLSTYGDTYQQAVDKCGEAILGFLEASQREGLPFPLADVEADALLESLTGHRRSS